jgi:site-specific recombinase XerD
MKRKLPTDLAQALARFFQEYLPAQRGMSLHTIRSYRDAVLLLLRFAAQETHQRLETLGLADFAPERVHRFLKHLETQRHNSITTRNLRLAALHTFARFLIGAYPERMPIYQRVLAIPFKRGAQQLPIDYLQLEEVQALLEAIDQTSIFGQRDYALYALMFNTGARVQEILDLRVRDVRFDPPHQVRLAGKGHKCRLCPIWPRVAKLLKDLVSRAHSTPDHAAETYLFRNRRGQPLTRFGVRYLLRKYLPQGAADRPSPLGKRLHPHSLRHTTAVYLLKAGIDFATISQWLGHANLNTTMRYARADIELKRQALAQVFPEILAPPTAGRIGPHGTEISTWLRRL